MFYILCMRLLTLLTASSDAPAKPVSKATPATKRKGE